MTAQQENERRELLNALKWTIGMLLVAAGFTAPFWLPASWILH